MSDIQDIEYEFQLKDMDVEIQRIEAELARLNLEKEKYIYQKVLLAHNYNEYIERGERFKEMSEKDSESIPESGLIHTSQIQEEIKELKPRRLKTT